MTDPRLWCLHHIGPDELHPAPDFGTAQKWASWANDRFANAADISRFVVAVWPWSAASHAEGLDASVKGWTLPAGAECHGLDTPERVCFYEQDFYVLSNFSAFTVWWKGLRFDTSEAVYHWEKFDNAGLTPFERAVLDSILYAPSAHEAFKIGQQHKRLRRPDWDDVKVDVMRDILRAKADQHEYVRRKLLATGERELVENSWRDDYWGWGPNRDGQNMLGKLWMEVRAELRSGGHNG
jgi:ribA/ribD-fused uncharacterized protein